MIPTKCENEKQNRELRRRNARFELFQSRMLLEHENDDQKCSMMKVLCSTMTYISYYGIYNNKFRLNFKLCSLHLTIRIDFDCF